VAPKFENIAQIPRAVFLITVGKTSAPYTKRKPNEAADENLAKSHTDTKIN
jgi:hypothetical protein